MAQYNYIIISVFLATFTALTHCDSLADKFCKHITCTKLDKECTKPLKPNAYCVCESIKGGFTKSYTTCPGPTVFNGANARCEPKSAEATLYCKNQQKNQKPAPKKSQKKKT
ncbi:uncharacterized protein LOC119765236 [Culex quinquefasciatus]|uniref:uncharacterized protein LOC119765236 n=1 Tax=Culex quinquefasciatus TaxID=7176 RepID=UPI0018E35763|nr:uncharacterized protein LOC119765236 [Culex quinquefasciatus]